MGLSKIRLGDYIERSTKNNRDERYGTEYIAGVNNTGVFTAPKGNPEGVNLKPYKIVNNGAFVYNPTRLDLGSIAYRTDGLCIVSHLYNIFYLTEEGKKIIDPTYLFMYFRRDEFCREVTFRNFGSQRPEFSFDDMSDIIMPLPSIEIQKKYVDIYNAMLENQKNYERGLDDIELSYNICIDQIKCCNLVKLGELIEIGNEKNHDEIYKVDALRGINEKNKFDNTTADVDEKALKNYLVVKDKNFAVNFMCLGNWGRFYLAYNDSKRSYLVSPACSSFKIKNEDELNPYYLFGLLKRPEFQRKCVFFGDGNTRGGINNNDFKSIMIPIASKDKQQIIAKLFIAYENRMRVNEILKSQIKNLCPILIKGSIEEARKEA